MLQRTLYRHVVSATLVGMVLSGLSSAWQASPQTDSSPEVSTEELERILATRSATVLDARPYLEFAISHIPGALNVGAKPGISPSLYISDVAEIGRLMQNRKAAPLVLYCNGPHCGKSKRLAAELRDAGYTNVRRYQLGVPTWRAAGGVCEIEIAGIEHVLARDGTAVVIDAREAADYKKRTIHGAHNIPRSLVLDGKDVGEVKRAKDDGRLPMEDHNTRLIVLGADAAAARYVAEALTREAFHNVSYFPGSFETVRQRLEGARRNLR
jgi:rhodanese-related sulfurtransferase